MYSIFHSGRVGTLLRKMRRVRCSGCRLQSQELHRRRPGEHRKMFQPLLRGQYVARQPELRFDRRRGNQLQRCRHRRVHAHAQRTMLLTLRLRRGGGKTRMRGLLGEPVAVNMHGLRSADGRCQHHTEHSHHAKPQRLRGGQASGLASLRQEALGGGAQNSLSSMTYAAGKRTQRGTRVST